MSCCYLTLWFQYGLLLVHPADSIMRPASCVCTPWCWIFVSRTRTHTNKTPFLAEQRFLVSFLDLFATDGRSGRLPFIWLTLEAWVWRLSPRAGDHRPGQSRGDYSHHPVPAACSNSQGHQDSRCPNSCPVPHSTGRPCTSARSKTSPHPCVVPCSSTASCSREPPTSDGTYRTGAVRRREVSWRL